MKTEKVIYRTSRPLTDWRTNKLNKLINARGRHEQDQALNFAGLYNNGHRLTRETKGEAANFIRNLKNGKFEC